MSIDKDLDQEYKRTKKRTKWGCLIWAAVLLLGPIILVVGLFFYESNFKESELVISHSPNNINTIKVVEKGSAFFFSPTTVRIKYGWKHIDHGLGNDGKTLDASNVTVNWENDDEATITLYGEEQIPEIVEFKVQGKNEPNSSLFNVVQSELGFFAFKTSESPNLINILEFREITNSKGLGPTSTVKIYYGKRGSILEKYKEYIPSQMYTPDNFEVDWENDEQVKIDLIRETEEGKVYVEDSFEIDLAK